MCNNKDKFQREMLRMGIHIPERDASWELEENAFQELLVRYQRCDVRKCYCRSGREYNEPDSEWEIFLCQCCGSSGTHRACSSLQQLVQSWECSECQSIVYTPGKDKRSHLGVEQPSPKCPRPSTSPRSKVQFRQIQPRIMPLVDILQELRQQINRDSVCTLCVKKRSFWSTSVKGFRKGSFSPSRTLQVKFTESNPRDANLPQQMPVAEFFKLLLSTLENSSLFEGSEHKNISLNLDAQSDNLYYEAGRMIAVSLVHGGPAPGFFSHTLFSCLANEPQHVQPVLEDVADPNVAQAILTIQSCRTIAKLKSVIINYLDYLLETDNLQLVQSVSDKFLLIKQILAHHVIRRVQAPLESFKEGMKTLGVLEKIQAYPSSFWSILCLKPEKLTSKIMLDLFTIKFNIHICPDKRNEVTSFWADYLEDSEEGTAANSLEEILRFATGLDSIPPAGFEPQPCIEFSNGTVPTSRKWANCIHLPVFSNYSEFQRSMDQAIGASRIA